MGRSGSWAFLVSLSLAFLSLAVACRSQPRVVISTQAGREVAIEVEIADTPAKREMGLQYRRDLAEDHGMLFIFPAETELSFWMKNTPISLDLIFISQTRTIVGIVADAVPFSTDSLSVSSPSRFVLEINGGLSRRHGIKPGDMVRFEGIAVDGVAR